MDTVVFFPDGKSSETCSCDQCELPW